MLLFDDIEKTYEGRTVLAVDDLRLDLGRIHALVGANGSGKTTMLKIAAMLLAPTQGRVTFDGTVITELTGSDLAQQRLRVCFLAQDPYLFAGTVLSNATYGLRARGIARPQAKRRAMEELDRLGIAGLADQAQHTLSAGERKKTALARCFATGADLFLLDEATANLDRESIPSVEARILSACADEGRTCILATHDVEQTDRLAPETSVHLLAGRVIEGDRRNVFAGNLTLEGAELHLALAGGVMLFLVGVPGRTGRATASINASDIILSSEPIHSSARNVLAGKVTRLEKTGNTFLVTVDVGIPLEVRITAASLAELELVPGSTVHVAFKASAVRLL
jgi:molybdopterin-binding protein